MKVGDLITIREGGLTALILDIKRKEYGGKEAFVKVIEVAEDSSYNHITAGDTGWTGLLTNWIVFDPKANEEQQKLGIDGDFRNKRIKK